VSPAEKVAAGLDLAAEGMAELRQERIHLAERLAANRAALAHGEGRALALRYQAHRDRDARVGGQVVPPRLHDGLRREGRDVGAEEERSLALYCPRGAVRAALPPKRGLWARWWGGG
jgi:hypothetical protein